MNSMHQTSKVTARDNVGKRRHCSLLPPELHALAGRNARIKWSGARKTAEVRDKPTTLERIKGGMAGAIPHHKFSEWDYLDQQQQQQQQQPQQQQQVQQTSTKR